MPFAKLAEQKKFFFSFKNIMIVDILLYKNMSVLIVRVTVSFKYL